MVPVIFTAECKGRATSASDHLQSATLPVWPSLRSVRAEPKFVMCEPVAPAPLKWRPVVFGSIMMPSGTSSGCMTWSTGPAVHRDFDHAWARRNLHDVVVVVLVVVPHGLDSMFGCKNSFCVLIFHLQHCSELCHVGMSAP
jgi:hypothetical protein